jgi:hypothetical protein
MIANGDAKFHTMTPHADSPLTLAIDNGHTAVVNSLIKHKVDVNYRGAGHVSPLGVAIARAETDVVHALLDAGADVTAHTSDGQSLVSIAIARHVPELVQPLLERGAPVDPPETALALTAEQLHEATHSTALYHAALHEDLASLRAVLPGSRLTGECGSAALSAAAEGDSVEAEGSAFNVILAEMRRRGALTRDCINTCLLTVFKKKSVYALSALLAAAEAAGVEVVNERLPVPHPWGFYFVKFKKDILHEFQKACGGAPGEDVSAFPLTVAVLRDWPEAARTLFQASEAAAHEEAVEVAAATVRQAVYEQAKEQQ